MVLYFYLILPKNNPIKLPSIGDLSGALVFARYPQENSLLQAIT
ncbi:MAG: hypothetical protein RLZ10_2456, partial [Bacteroidota bacterium]